MVIDNSELIQISEETWKAFKYFVHNKLIFHIWTFLLMYSGQTFSKLIMSMSVFWIVCCCYNWMKQWQILRPQLQRTHRTITYKNGVKNSSLPLMGKIVWHLSKMKKYWTHQGIYYHLGLTGCTVADSMINTASFSTPFDK